MKQPTARQFEVHAFMLAYREQHSMWPTVREIATAIGVVSTNGVVDMLNALKRKGYARHRPFCARGWIAVEQPDETSPTRAA